MYRSYQLYLKIIGINRRFGLFAYCGLSILWDDFQVNGLLDRLIQDSSCENRSSHCRWYTHGDHNLCEIKVKIDSKADSRLYLRHPLEPINLSEHNRFKQHPITHNCHNPQQRRCISPHNQTIILEHIHQTNRHLYNRSLTLHLPQHPVPVPEDHDIQRNVLLSG